MMVSAVDRLMVLPEAFRDTDVMASFGWTAKHTNEMLHRWKTKNLVTSLGKRLGVYANNLKVPESERTLAMLNKMDPHFVDLTHRTLSDAGWTTQFVNNTIVTSALLVGGDVVSDHGVLKYKPLRWWKTVFPGIIKKRDSEKGLHKLKPEWLLAESLFSRDKSLWCPDPDDLDFDEIEQNCTRNDWQAAFTALAHYYNEDYKPSGASLEDEYARLWHVVKSGNPANDTPDNECA